MKIALITGASSGLGKEFAIQIAKKFDYIDEIWLIARREERLKKMSNLLSVPVRVFAYDLGEEEVYQALDKSLKHDFADVKILVNAAGYGWNGGVSSKNIDEQTGMIDINCTALTRIILLSLPYMKKGSKIINVASSSAFSPQPGFAIYAATKSYVYSFSKSLGAELSGKGITVTVVCPGPVNTEFFKRSGEVAGSVKNKLRSNASEVVRQALKDTEQGKSISVYGNAMKIMRIIAKIVPDDILIAVMKRINRIGV